MATWTIANLERNLDGGVIVAHWRATEIDGEHSASSYGTVGLTPDPSSDDFVEFDNLTEEAVIAWLHLELDKDSIETALASSIEQKKAPQTLTGLPW